MGKILRTKKFTTGFEAFIVLIGLAIILTGVYYLAPGLRVSGSKTLEGLTLNKDHIDNDVKGAELPLPSTKVSSDVSDKPLVRIAEYAWNGNSGMIAANGGPRTTNGSLFESYGINLEIVREDMVVVIRKKMFFFDM